MYSIAKPFFFFLLKQASQAAFFLQVAMNVDDKFVANIFFFQGKSSFDMGLIYSFYLLIKESY